MVNREENELLTRVEGDAPMGRLMRENYWIPFALSSQLAPSEPPLPIRLLGENYVAFRAVDGRIGFFDELCPHRRASLALARAEGDGLRCINHGWKLDVSGCVVEAPTQALRPDEFAARIRVGHFPVHEAGGLAWVWLGESEAPTFPDMPFVGEHEANTWLSVTLAPCNWLQGVEGTLDSAHVGILHQSWIRDISKAPEQANIGLALDNPPRYETRVAPYGLRAAALRDLDDGRTYARVTEYFMPFVCLLPEARPLPKDGYLFIFSPVDDTHHLFFYGLYSEHVKKQPHDVGFIADNLVPDIYNFAPVSAGRDGRWGQDRVLMNAGHHTGFGRTLVEEDMVVLASMGPTVDRTKENLSSSDVAIVAARHMLLQVLEDARAGALPPGSALAPGVVSVTNPLDAVLEAGMCWEDYTFDRPAA